MLSPYLIRYFNARSEHTRVCAIVWRSTAERALVDLNVLRFPAQSANSLRPSDGPAVLFLFQLGHDGAVPIAMSNTLLH